MSTDAANIARAAKIVSMRPADIASADESPAGFVIVDTRGVKMIDVPADRPDAEGKTGLMLLVQPNPDRTYDFPVYAPPEPDDEDQDTASEPAHGDGDAAGAPTPPARPEPPPKAGRGSGEKAWREWATHPAVDVDVSGCESRDDVIAACIAAGVLEEA